MKVLFTWIGHADLKAFFSVAKTELKQNIHKEIGDFTPLIGKGPVKSLLEQESFDEIHILSNYDKGLTREYKKWIEQDAILHFPGLIDPTDYGQIYNAVDSVMDKSLKRKSKPEISILLSPGTPAMAAIWIIISKTKYPAMFWQTHNNIAKQTNIPFDFTADVIPELLKNSDNIFQHLISRSPEQIKGFEKITGNSQAIRLAVGRAEKAAVRDVTVLITGESGTGKELFARAIRDASKRRGKPFEVINCAAIPASLLESELFGYAKGAFTGATKDKPGAFERADSGILFLDEVGECPLDIQAKLLRVLQPPPGKGMCYREFMPVGGIKLIKSDVRIIAATNRDLPAMFKDNEFREDLYYRLAMITVRLPSLRSRKEDIPALAEILLKQINEEFAEDEVNYKYKEFSDTTKRFMSNYDWPGNTRELYNAILQSVVMGENEKIRPEEIQAALGKNLTSSNEMNLHALGNGFELDEYLNTIRIKYIKKAMDEAAGIKVKAASLLGMKNYQTLDNQIKRFKIKV